MTSFKTSRILLGHYYRLFGPSAVFLLADRFLRRSFAGKHIVRFSWGRWSGGSCDGSRTETRLIDAWGAREESARGFAERFPNVVEQKLAAANRICRHEFDFLGTGPTNWGEPIEWHQDVKSGHHWPVKFYTEYTRHEVTPGRGADPKIPWELSRLHHFVTLGQAWWLTGEGRYVHEFFAQWQSWLSSNPWLYGINWTCAMEAAIRAVNLLWAAALLAGAPGWTAERRRALSDSLEQHGRYIEHNLEVGVEEGHIFAANHYLANICGLACLGLCCPQVRGADRWRCVGLKGLEQEMRRQVLSDGFFYESSTAYHRLAVELFLVPALLAPRDKQEMSPTYWRRLEQMLEVILYLSGPNGCVPQFGDSDDGRLLIFSEYPGWARHDYRYLLALGSVLFGRTDFRVAASGYAEEVFWLLGQDGVQQFDETESDPRPPGSRGFPEAGLYVIRSEDGRDFALVRAGGPPAHAPAGHAHNDSLSLELWLDGQPVLADPGTFCYTSNPVRRDYFRSTMAHNGVRVDGHETSTLDAVFQLKGRTTVRLVHWTSNSEEICLALQQTHCPQLSQPVSHRRSVRYRPSHRQWEIEDLLTGEGNHVAELRYHFSPDAIPQIFQGPPHLGLKVGNATLYWTCAGDSASQYMLSDDFVSPYFGVLETSKRFEISLRWTGKCHAKLTLVPSQVQQSGVGMQLSPAHIPCQQ